MPVQFHIGVLSRLGKFKYDNTLMGYSGVDKLIFIQLI